MNDGQPTGTNATPIDEPPRRSPWTLRQKLLRVAWSFVWATVWRWSPRGWPSVRTGLLRLFGARIGRGVRIDPSVHVEIPWHLDLGTDVRIEEGAILYCLGPVRIGPRTLIGPLVHVCAGTHDHTTRAFTLLRPPIEIGADCLLLTAAFVGPGAVLADGTVARERASLYGRTDADTVYEGNPGRPVGRRAGTAEASGAAGDGLGEGEGDGVSAAPPGAAR